jgi:hypothetical protein
MILMKADRPRRIDDIIDYFGEARRGVPADPRLPDGTTAGAPLAPQGEAA